MYESRIVSFPPVCPSKPEILILGSIPGVRSLKDQQYYAHPRNAFWKIIGTFVGFEANLSYQQRIEKLKEAKIALWDVLKSCERKGSLDSSIKKSSERFNELAVFLLVHQTIKRVFLNGKKTARLFNHHILYQLEPRRRDEIKLIELPSTSPANATLSFESKKQIWLQRLMTK